MHSQAQIGAVVETCPECGKLYVRRCTKEAWGYACAGELVCSYGCMRERSRRVEKSLEKTEKMDKRERNEEILKLWREGVPAKEIGMRTGLSMQGVWYVIRNAKVKEEVNEAAGKTSSTAAAVPLPLSGEGRENGEDSMVEDLKEQLEDARRHINELREALERETGARWAAYKLMMLWRDKYDKTVKLDRIEKDIVKTEGELYSRLREVCRHERVETAEADPAPEAGAGTV